ncbi:hypothetical protein OEZ86_001802 [Tetradesmus obliquus]|nr:hypothetical protein OEZ86_001802 [Tetradesmus obliquus]
MARSRVPVAKVQLKSTAHKAVLHVETPVECPLCIETLDDTDRDFFPCPCGYQVCLFCYQRLQNEYNNTCPGCRQQYGDDLDAVRQHIERKHKQQQQEVTVAARTAEQQQQQQQQQGQLDRRASSGFTSVEVTTVVAGSRHSVCVPVSNHSEVAPFPEAATLLEMLQSAVNGSKLSSTEAAVQLVQCLRKLEADSQHKQQQAWLQQALANGNQISSGVLAATPPAWACTSVWSPGGPSTTACADASCNPKQANLAGQVLVLSVASMLYTHGGFNAAGSNPADCCKICKNTDLCNAWVFCNQREGCGPKGSCSAYINSLTATAMRQDASSA